VINWGAQVFLWPNVEPLSEESESEHITYNKLLVGGSNWGVECANVLLSGSPREASEIPGMRLAASSIYGAWALGLGSRVSAVGEVPFG
jgi:hypothetical protein